MVTLPIVRIKSGKASIATKITKGSMGTPIAMHIGAMEAIKLTDPGKLTAPNVVVAATATPIARAVIDKSSPNK